MTIQDLKPTSYDLFTLIRQITTTLHSSPQVSQPEQEAWWIVESLLSKKRSTLLCSREQKLSSDQLIQLDDWLRRRTVNHEPLQYILGYVPFCNLQLTIAPPVLIPRPETEEWCAKLINELTQIQHPLSILDLCTGSGCIALALASKLPNSNITAVDISPQAITLATLNQRNLGIKNVVFIQSDLFSAIQTKTFDIIVANPPYLSANDYDNIDNSVKLWEDKAALTPGPSGLELYYKIIQQAPKHLNQPITSIRPYYNLVLEIGHKQADSISSLLPPHFSLPTVWLDSSNKPRTILTRTQSWTCYHTRSAE